MHEQSVKPIFYWCLKKKKWTCLARQMPHKRNLFICGIAVVKLQKHMLLMKTFHHVMCAFVLSLFKSSSLHIWWRWSYIVWTKMSSQFKYFGRCAVWLCCCFFLFYLSFFLGGPFVWFLNLLDGKRNEQGALNRDRGGNLQGTITIFPLWEQVTSLPNPMKLSPRNMMVPVDLHLVTWLSSTLIKPFHVAMSARVY